MSSGINGFNVRINGVSRDQVMAAHARVGGGFMLIQNNAELVPMARAAGVKTIYRQSGDGGIPDTPTNDILREWVERFVAERAAKGADYVHLFNEIEDSPRLHLATQYALDYAIPRGIKLAVYNYGTNAKRWWFENARTNIQRAIAHGMVIGIHVYLELEEEHRDGAFEWLSMKHELGGLWVATEFNFIRSIFDAERGPRNYLGAQGRITWEQFAERFTPFFASENIPLCWFSFDDWPDDPKKKADGFGYWNTPDFQKKLGLLNQVQTIKEVNPVTQPTNIPKPNTQLYNVVAVTVPGGVRNVRKQPAYTSDDVGDLVPTNKVRAYLDSPQTGATSSTTSGKWIYCIFPDGIEGWAWFDGVTYGRVTPSDGTEVIIGNADLETLKLVSSALGRNIEQLQTSRDQIDAVIKEQPRKLAAADFEITVMLEGIPYVSQWDDTAHLARGDCGIVAACSVALSKGIQTTPDAMLKKANLPVGKHSYSFDEVMRAASAVGLTLKYHYPARQSEIEDELRAGRPTVTLLRYGSLSKNQDDFDGSHFVTVVGFDPDWFYIHDPDWWQPRRKEGAQRRVPRREFEVAIGLALNPTGNRAWQSLFVS